jgi:Protein of unknown function (DUF4007)
LRSDQLVASCEHAFARHETFHPRYGWLRKAFEAVEADPDAFSQPDATVRLGVGKNMVAAIRYWGLATKLLATTDASPGHPRTPNLVATDLAQVVLGTNGWDPYLEDPATLWLLHWQMLRPPSLAPMWWVAFNLLDAEQFTDDDLIRVARDAIDGVDDWPPTAIGSLKKDADCVIRMYTSRASGRQSLDDLLDCPFRELRILEPVHGEHRTYRFNVGTKVGLVPAIVCYASLDYLETATRGVASMSLSRLATDVGGPGRAFRLTESELASYISDAGAAYGVQVAEPAGSKQLYCEEAPAATGRQVLADYYRSRNGSTQRWQPGMSGPQAAVEAQLLDTIGQLHQATRAADRRRFEREIQQLKSQYIEVGRAS